MSHCARRMCSSSCHGVYGAPSGLRPRSSCGKSLSEPSRSTWASALMIRLVRCWRSGSFFMAVALDDGEQAREQNMLTVAIRGKAASCPLVIGATVGLWLLAGVAIDCRAQGQSSQAQGSQNVPTLRTQSNVVLVPTLVKGKGGKPVFGLQPGD